MEETRQDCTFEEAVTRLEEIVSRMEGGSLSLDDCLRHFEQAVSLSRHCAARLETAEQQIRILSAEGGLLTAAEAGWQTERQAGPALDPFAD